MKNALALCSLALNPHSPSPTGTMVRVADGHMTAFGGSICISVPFPTEIGCCFNPQAVAPFFRKERKAIAYTLNKNKLVLKEGKERLTVGCLPPEEMAIIDNLEAPVPASLNTPLLKIAANIACTDEGAPPFAHGVVFADGSMSATNNRVFLCGDSGLPDDMEFALTKDACVALTKFKSPVVSVAMNKHTVKFIFGDGSSLCARQLLCAFPDISPLFAGKWTDLNLTEDLSSVECDHLEFLEGSVYYHNKDSVGMLEKALSDKIKVKVYKRSFDHLIKAGNKISVSEDNLKLKSVGDKCVIISSVKTG